MNVLSDINWKEVKLSDVIEIIGGGTPKTRVEKYWNGDIPWLSVKDFNNGNRYVYKTEKYITESGLQNSSAKLLDKDDLIISARGTVGEIAQLGKKMAFNQSCYGLKGKHGLITNTFLYYLLRYSIKDIQSNTHGSVFDTITRETFNVLEVSIPSLSEQKSIADTLSCLDDKIELNYHINKNLEEIAQAILKSWFIDFDPFQYGEFEDSELGRIPKGWRAVELNDICKQIKPGTNFQPKRTEKGIPFLNVRNINAGSIDLSDVKYISNEDYEKVHKMWQPEQNDLLISRIGTLGLVAVIRKKDLPLTVHYNFINIKTSIIPFQVMYFILKSDYFQQKYNLIKKQSVQEYVTIDEVEKINLILPSDINLLRDCFDTLECIYNKIESNQMEKQKLTAIRDSLLPKLMNGEIRIPIQEMQVDGQR